MLDWSLLAPALAAGLLVLLTHIPLGRVVLQRGIIFIDLAIAQIAGLGVIAAYSLGWEVHGYQTQLIALGAAIGGALLLAKAEKKIREQQEAFIGIIYVLAATAALLLLSHNPHGGEHLQNLLIGQILWTTWETLIPLSAITLLFGLLYWMKTDLLESQYFYLVFATVITFSVQIVGVYLVFSSLVIPAFAVYRVKQKPLRYAYILGGIGYIIGLLVSMYFDAPAGAAIVWSLFLAAAAYLLIKKR